jgi:glycosyltransferase involved in cell wall biosynthesis
MAGLFNQEGWRVEAVRSRPVSAMIAVSDLVRRQYLARNPEYPSDRIVTVPNGVGLERLVRVDRQLARNTLGLRDDFLFLCLARYTPQKNLIGLVRAFIEVADRWPQARLLIAGEVHDQLYYAQVARVRDRSPHAARIDLRGHCSRIPVLLAAADAFVLDSFFEGWPLAPTEALTSGLPVVMSEVGGAHELVGKDGTRGYIVPNPLGDAVLVDMDAVRAARYRRHLNHDALVSAMSAVLDDRHRWARIREQLRTDSVRMFHPEVCLHGHARVLAATAERIPIPVASIT